jgi:hypothetical protein
MMAAIRESGCTPQFQLILQLHPIWQGSLYKIRCIHGIPFFLQPCNDSTNPQNVKWSRKQRHPRATDHLSSKYEPQPSDSCLFARKLYINIYLGRRERLLVRIDEPYAYPESRYRNMLSTLLNWRVSLLLSGPKISVRLGSNFRKVIPNIQ